MFRIIPLDERILFDAAVAPVISEATQADTSGNDSFSQEGNNSTETSDSSDSTVLSLSSGENTPLNNSGSVKILLVSSEIQDAENFIENADPQTKVILYDAANINQNDLLQEIKLTLDGNLASNIGFATEGASGQIRLGTEQIILSDNIETLFGDFFHELGGLLQEGGTVDFFACYLSQDSTALADQISLFVNELGTDISVRTSTDRTGNDTTSSNWNLEAGGGSLLLYLDGIQLSSSWIGDFATYTVTSNADSGTNTLRWAIEQANSNLGEDTILISNAAPFNTNTNPIMLTSALPEITESVIISYGSTTTPILAGKAIIDGTDAGSGVSGIVITEGNLKLLGIEIRNFSLDGVRTTTPGDVIISASYIHDNGGWGINILPTSSSGQAVKIGFAWGGNPNYIYSNGSGGIHIDGGSANVDIAGNKIGLNTLNQAAGNTGDGIYIENSTNVELGSYNNGITNATNYRNIISDNSGYGVHFYNSHNISILNTYIGTSVAGAYLGKIDASGKAGNSLGGIYFESSPDGTSIINSNITIGGTWSNLAERNTISNNYGSGITIDAGTTSILIKGNTIGMSFGAQNGTIYALPNSDNGILDKGSINSTIGSMTDATLGNVISYNGKNGIEITGPVSNLEIGQNKIGVNTFNGAAGNGINGVYIHDTTGSSDPRISFSLNTMSSNKEWGIKAVSTDHLYFNRNFVGINKSNLQLSNNSGGISFTDVNFAYLIDNYLSGNQKLATSNTLTAGLFITGDSSNINIHSSHIGLDRLDASKVNSVGIWIQGIGVHDVHIGSTDINERNVISGNNYAGILLDNVGSNIYIYNNYIGTTSDGLSRPLSLTNDYGVYVKDSAATNVFIGGYWDGSTIQTLGNIISANELYSLYIENSQGVSVLGNNIGLSVSPSTINDPPRISFGGTAGIYVKNSSNILIEGNEIGGFNYYTTSAGIKLENASSINSMSGNKIYNNFIGVDRNLSIFTNYTGISIESAFDTASIFSTEVDGNTIGGNTTSGIYIGRNSVSTLGVATYITNNFIGISSDGNSTISNNIGISVRGEDGTLISGNVIAANTINISIHKLSDFIIPERTLVQGNFIGIHPDKTATPDNFYITSDTRGIVINSGGSGITIGGTLLQEINYIAGSYRGIEILNTDIQVKIQGNTIGLNTDNTIVTDGNGSHMHEGIFIDRTANNHLLKGSSDAALVVTGSDTGIYIGGDNNVIYGAYIGLDRNGDTKGNGTGIKFGDNARWNQIGNASLLTVVSGNTENGIWTTQGADNQTITNTWVGLGIDGTTNHGNGKYGLLIESNSNSIKNSVFSYNTLYGAAVMGTIIQNDTSNLGTPAFANTFTNNIFGGNALGTTASLNGYGSLLLVNANSTTVGGSTSVANRFFDTNGIVHAAGIGGFFSYNLFYGANGFGIDLGAIFDGTTFIGDGFTTNDASDLDSGPNLLQNFIAIDHAYNVGGTSVEIAGSLTSSPNKSFQIEVYGNTAAHYKASLFLGSFSVTTNGQGVASFTNTLALPGGITNISVLTINKGSRNTSEFNIAAISKAPTPALALEAATSGGAPTPQTNNSITDSLSNLSSSEQNNTNNTLLTQTSILEKSATPNDPWDISTLGKGDTSSTTLVADNFFNQFYAEYTKKESYSFVRYDNLIQINGSSAALSGFSPIMIADSQLSDSTPLKEVLLQSVENSTTAYIERIITSTAQETVSNSQYEISPLDDLLAILDVR